MAGPRGRCLSVCLSGELRVGASVCGRWLLGQTGRRQRRHLGASPPSWIARTGEAGKDSTLWRGHGRATAAPKFLLHGHADAICRLSGVPALLHKHARSLSYAIISIDARRRQAMHTMQFMEQVVRRYLISTV